VSLTPARVHVVVVSKPAVAVARRLIAELDAETLAKARRTTPRYGARAIRRVTRGVRKAIGQLSGDSQSKTHVASTHVGPSPCPVVGLKLVDPDDDLRQFANSLQQRYGADRLIITEAPPGTVLAR